MEKFILSFLLTINQKTSGKYEPRVTSHSKDVECELSTKSFEENFNRLEIHDSNPRNTASDHDQFRLQVQHQKTAFKSVSEVRERHYVQ